jgi:phosphinothricin acetyltransferase
MLPQVIRILPMAPEDWQDVARIHQEGIDTGNATFETSPPPTWDEWQKSKMAVGRLAACRGDRVVGWAALSPTSQRRCYTGVAEASIYVAGEARGQGVGSLLMAALIAESEVNGIWMLQATVFPENEASLRLLKKYGFRVVGRRERIGRMETGPRRGEWRDTILLERRSPVVGQ